MLRSKNRGQPSPSIMLRTDKSWTSVVKGCKNNPHTNESENDVTSRMESMSISRQLEWPTYQENGQRKYGPPNWWTGPPPQKGTEVFLSRLHRQVLEDELCPVLSTVGTIYTFRLMMDFSGSNRGYGFVQYATREEALRAIEELNEYPIRPNVKMTVEESLDNCRLFIGHIPKDLTESKLKIILGKYVQGLKHVFLYMTPNNKKENRGFCFVEFEDHRSAAMGRRYLLCSGIPEWKSIEITVDWAIPETEVPQSVMEKVTVIYIRNLLITTTEERIRLLLESITINVSFISKIKKVKDFAFVHFANRPVANYALNNLDGAFLDGARLSVSWAKPPAYRYNGEYYYAGNLSESYADSDSSSRRDSFGSIQSSSSRRESFGSTQGSSSDGHNSMLRGAPLFKHKDKLPKSKHPMLMEPSSRFKNVHSGTTDSYHGSVGSCSPSSMSHWGSYRDDGYVTDRSSTLGHPIVDYPLPVISSTPSYRALVESLLPCVNEKSTFQDQQSLPTAFDLNSNFNLHQYAQFEGISSRIMKADDLFFFSNPKVVSAVPDTETNEYHCMKESVSKLLAKHSECAYEVLKIIAEDFEWGTVFYHPLQLNGGWMVSIRVKKGDVIKTLIVLENLCETENDALNIAASKFLQIQLIVSGQRSYVIGIQTMRSWIHKLLNTMSSHQVHHYRALKKIYK